MRIFHFISHFDLGGAEMVAANIARSGSQDMEYHLVEMMRGKSPYTKKFLSEMEASGVRCHRAWMPDIRWHFVVERITALLFPIRLLYIWLRWRPDVLHCHTELPDMGIVAAIQLFPFIARRCRIVRTIHNNVLWTGQERIGNFCESVFHSSNCNIAISQSVRHSYMERYGEDTPIIYNGVAKPVSTPYPHLIDDKTNVVFAGRFEAQKGISTLVEVISRLADDERYHFHIFGEGSLGTLIQQRLGSQGNVSINPPLFGLSSYLPSFDYMFMPSEFEGLSIVAIEASMAGLPNIINDCPGLGEVLPEDWQLKVKGNDVEAFVDIFRNKITEASRNNLGAKAMEYAEQNFSITTMQRNYERIYRQGIPQIS